MQLQVPMVVVTHADAYLCLLQNAAQVLQHKEHGWTTCGALRAGESTAVSRTFLHVVRQDLRTPSARPPLITHKLPITMQARPRLCQRTHGLTVQASVISPSRFNQNWNCYDVMIISPTSPLPLQDRLIHCLDFWTFRRRKQKTEEEREYCSLQVYTNLRSNTTSGVSTAGHSRACNYCCYNYQKASSQHYLSVPMMSFPTCHAHIHLA